MIDDYDYNYHYDWWLCLLSNMIIMIDDWWFLYRSAAIWPSK